MTLQAEKPPLGIVYVTRCCTPDQYLMPEYRRLSEGEARREMARVIKMKNLALLDAPAGRWHEVRQFFEGDSTWVHWEYRLRGAYLMSAEEAALRSAAESLPGKPESL